jgi:hypothetical protein
MFATDEELVKWPILHFDYDELTPEGRRIYRRCAGGSYVPVREQLDALRLSAIEDHPDFEATREAWHAAWFEEGKLATKGGVK